MTKEKIKRDITDWELFIIIMLGVALLMSLSAIFRGTMFFTF